MCMDVCPVVVFHAACNITDDSATFRRLFQKADKA